MCKLSSNFASNVKVALKGFHFVKTSVQGLRWINVEIQRVTHFKPGYKVFKLENALQYIQYIQGVTNEIQYKEMAMVALKLCVFYPLLIGHKWVRELKDYIFEKL